MERSSARQHAGDVIADAVETDRASYDAAVAVKTPLPKLIAQHHGVRRARPALLRQESRGRERGRRPITSVKFTPTLRGKDALGLAAAGEVEAVLGRSVPRREAGEGVRLALPVEQVLRRNADLFVAVRPIGLPDDDDAVGVADRAAAAAARNE